MQNRMQPQHCEAFLYYYVGPQYLSSYHTYHDCISSALAAEGNSNWFCSYHLELKETDGMWRNKDFWEICSNPLPLQIFNPLMVLALLLGMSKLSDVKFNLFNTVKLISSRVLNPGPLFLICRPNPSLPFYLTLDHILNFIKCNC